MDYDRILTQLGEFGAWQRRNYFLLWLPTLAAGINIMTAAWSVMPPREYRCRNECDKTNFSFEIQGHDLSEIFPSFDENSSDYNEATPNYCRYYKAIQQDNGECQFTKEVLSCQHGAQFAFTPFEMSSTLAMDSDLVCQDFYWTIIIDEFFMAGLMVGSSLFGIMADRIGRRHTIVISLVCCALGNLLGCVMTSAWSYGLTRILASAGGIGASITAFTMTLEIIGVRETLPLMPWVTVSTFLANFAAIPTAIGETVPSLVAYGLTDWRVFQAVLALIIGLTSLLWFLLPESPRWLIAKGRTDAALDIIKTASGVNKVKLSPDLLSSGLENAKAVTVDAKQVPQYGILDIFRMSQLPITLALFVCWPVSTLLYYGLSLSANKIHMTNDVYLSFILVCLIEIPAYTLIPFVIDILGRKPVLFITLFIPGICCIVAAFLTPGSVIFTVLALGAKLGASAAFNVIYMYTAQLYPTSIRNSAVGACSTMARVGGFLSPIIGKYLVTTGAVDEKLPMILFGAFGIIGGLCTLVLPDSVGFPLPNTFEDINDIKKNSKPMWRLHKPTVYSPL